MWEQAESDYMAGMKYKEIAEKYNVSLSTVKSWKTRYKWNRKGTHTKSKKVRVQNEKSTHTKPSANATSFKKGNRAAVGHGAPPENQNAAKHGYYSRFIPVNELEMLVDAPGAGRLETELKFTRFRLARLVQYHEQQRLEGTVVGPDGVKNITLKDDFYELMIQKLIKQIVELEFKIHKMQMDSSEDHEESAINIIVSRKNERDNNERG